MQAFDPVTVRLHIGNRVAIYSRSSKEKIDFAELPSAQILKLEPAKVEGIGEEVKSIISDVAHLF